MEFEQCQFRGIFGRSTFSNPHLCKEQLKHVHFSFTQNHFFGKNETKRLCLAKGKKKKRRI
jgi:hypothetical protein